MFTAYTAGHVFEFRASSRCNLIGRFAGNGKNVDRLFEGGQPLAHSCSLEGCCYWTVLRWCDVE